MTTEQKAKDYAIKLWEEGFFMSKQILIDAYTAGYEASTADHDAEMLAMAEWISKNSYHELSLLDRDEVLQAFKNRNK